MIKKCSRGTSAIAAALSLAFAVSSCGRPNRFVWVQDMPRHAQASAATYRVEYGDVLDIRVYNEDRLSAKARVRSDGRITVPLVGDVVARGRTPDVLAKEIATRMQKFLNAPIVTVGVDESRPMTITVVGEAATPGVFTLPPHAGVLQALASAGGLSEFADPDEIYVVRQTPPQRIRFTYHALTNNDAAAASFALKNGDVISVE